MNIQDRTVGLTHTLISRTTLLLFCATATLFPGWAIPGDPTSQAVPVPHTHMSETLRTSLKKVVVLPGTAPAEGAITGSYEKGTLGLLDGMDAGSRIGDGVTKEIAGIPISIPFPILTIPGAIFGGISGKAKREIQEFRDALTADLARAASQPLTNEALASDVFWGLRNIPSLDSKVFALTTPIPEDTDAILYVSLTDVIINVDGSDAIITTSASATLRRMSNGEHVFGKTVYYEDRDSLANWTKNDNAAWRDYANFARHYIGREISAQVYERVELLHELQPTETDTVSRVKKNAWQGVSRSPTPTLAWKITMLEDASYGSEANLLDQSDISYEIEIYDMHQPVYVAKNIAETRHTVAVELEACKTYRWSVRPSYHIGSDTRFGDWMRFDSKTITGNGNVGTQASVVAAYIQDFALLEIKCGRR